MFDIGFSEIILIVVVALVVMGPNEFPVMVRSIARGLGKLRHFVDTVKDEFEREVTKSEELKERIKEETKIAEMHQQLDETRRSIPLDYHVRRGTVAVDQPSSASVEPAQPEESNKPL